MPPCVAAGAPADEVVLGVGSALGPRDNVVADRRNSAAVNAAVAVRRSACARSFRQRLVEPPAVQFVADAVGAALRLGDRYANADQPVVDLASRQGPEGPVLVEHPGRSLRPGERTFLRLPGCEPEHAALLVVALAAFPGRRWIGVGAARRQSLTNRIVSTGSVRLRLTLHRNHTSGATARAGAFGVGPLSRGRDRSIAEFRLSPGPKTVPACLSNRLVGGALSRPDGRGFTTFPGLRGATISVGAPVGATSRASRPPRTSRMAQPCASRLAARVQMPPAGLANLPANRRVHTVLYSTTSHVLHEWDGSDISGKPGGGSKSAALPTSRVAV